MELNEKEKEALRIILKAAPNYGVFHAVRVADELNTISIVGDEIRSMGISGFLGANIEYPAHVYNISEFLKDEGFSTTEKDFIFRFSFTDKGRELKAAGGIDEYSRKKKLNKGGSLLWKVTTGILAIATVYLAYSANRTNDEMLQLQIKQTESSEELKTAKEEFHKVLTVLDSVVYESNRKDTIIMNLRK